MQYSFEIEENITTGYRWFIETNGDVIKDEHVADPRYPSITPDGHAICGTPGLHKFTVDYVGTNEEEPLTIELVYQRPWLRKK